MDGERTPLLSVLTKEQKTGFVLLLFFAVLAIGLGTLQIRNTIYAPFALSNTVPNIYQNQVNTIDALKLRDTDHDGLNDFDELYIYHTSPYLWSTAGDNVSDGDKINKYHANPLCPLGQTTCALAANGTVDVGINTTSGTTTQATIDTSVTQETVLNDVNQLLDPVQLRQNLIDAGVSPTTLQNVTDNQLLGMVQQIIQNSSTLATIIASSSATTSSPQ